MPMDMRVRFPELLKRHGLTTYGFVKAAGGAISASQAYRLKRSGGRAEFFDARALQVMCDVFHITDLNELFSRDDEAPAPKAPKARGQRKPAK